MTQDRFRTITLTHKPALEIWQPDWPLLVWSERRAGDRSWVMVRERRFITKDRGEPRPIGSLVVYGGNTRGTPGLRPGIGDERAGEELPPGSDSDAIAAAIRRVCIGVGGKRLVSPEAEQDCISHLKPKEV